MKKSQLYQNTAGDKEKILRSLRAVYALDISRELTRLQGRGDREMIEAVLEDVHARLPEISPECDVSLLVSHCVRLAAGLDSTLPKDTAPAEDSPFDLSTLGGRLAARRHSVARYAIPISCLLVLLGLLLLYLFPPF